jgi:hypothetical protein
MGRNVPARGKSPSSIKNRLRFWKLFRRYWLTLRSWEWAFFSLAILIQNGSFISSMNRSSKSRTAPECLEQLFLRLTGGTRAQEGTVNASPEGSSSACVLAIGEGFSYFGQNCCTLLRSAQEAAGSKRSLLRPDWRGM